MCKRITPYFNVTTAAKEVRLSRSRISRGNIVSYLTHLGLWLPKTQPLQTSIKIVMLSDAKCLKEQS